jgi:CDP-diglyceride synthetase
MYRRQPEEDARRLCRRRNLLRSVVLPGGLDLAGKLFSWPVAAPLGIILSFTTQVGDLTESLLKRRFGVKDSSSLLPNSAEFST